MQRSDSGSTQLISERKSPLMKLWINLKNSIFDVLFVVMDKTSGQNEDLTIASLLYQSGVDYLQMMQFPFDATIIMVWNGGETLNNIFNFLTNIIAIDSLMPGINYSAFLIILYLIIFSIVLVILDIVYVSYSFNRKKFRFTLPLVLLAQIVPLFVTLLFIPVTEFLLNIINCTASVDNPDVLVMAFFPDVICFQGTHIIHVTITLFFTSLFVFISTVVAMTLFEPRMTSNTIAARKSSDGEVIFIVNKIICQFFFSFAPFKETWIYIILMFFPALWLFYFYHFHQPYYTREVGKLYRIFSVYYFWTVLMLTISQIALLLNFNFQGSMVIWFCGLPFIGMNIGYESKSNIEDLFSSNLKFKSGEELEGHLMYVLKLIHDRKQDQNANMLLVGYIQKHIQTCVEDDCPIKVKKPKKEQLLSQMDENCKLLVIQIERMYKQGIKKFPNCTKLHISFALFYMERLQLNAKAYQEFVMAEKASPSFVEQFIIYRFKKIIKEKLEENKEEENDLIEVIRFDNHVALCEEAMLLSAKLHKEFWTELSEETPNLLKLNQTGSKIIGIVNSVKTNYNQVRKINSHAPQIVHNYGVYSMFIAQKISQGKRCLAQSKKAYYEKRVKGDLSNDDGQMQLDQSNSSVVVSAVAGAMGKILVVNDNFVEMSGYLKEQITEKSIQKILPQVMMFYHDYAMNRWLGDTSRLYMQGQGNSYFRQTHKGFIKHKNGFIIPVAYKVSYSIFQQKFHVNFRHQKEFSDNFDFKMFIITDAKGTIKDISALGYSYLNLNKDNLSSSQRYIDQFGVNFSADLYTEGVILNISKKALFRNQETIESRDVDSVKDGRDGEEFYVKSEKIMMPFCPQEEEENDLPSMFIRNGKKNIGVIFYFQKMPAVDRAKSRDVKLQSLGHFEKDIMQMYQQYEEPGEQSDEQNPLMKSRKSRAINILSDLVKQEEEHEIQERTFHDYATKIKTYRLVNNQLKRVVEEYGVTTSDADSIDQENIGSNTFQMQKLKNPLYIQKILSAINANIDHRQVNILKMTFGIFLVTLITFTVLTHVNVNSQLNVIKKHMNSNSQWVKDQFYLSNLMHLSYNLSQETNVTSARMANKDYALGYTIAFNPDVLVNITDASGNRDRVRLNQAMIWIQAYLINIFESSNMGSQNNQLLTNYYQTVFPALQNYQPPFEASILPTILFMAAIFFISWIIVAIWIYNAMKIDIKCFDIILWFLDIPVAYVGYLQANCNTYIKTYIPVKQLIDKGINFHDRNLYLDDYDMDPQANNDKFNQQSKERKILIARHKKKTWLSRCDCGYVQLLWLLFYALLFWVLYIVVLQEQLTFYHFLNGKWSITAREFLWSTTIPNTLRLTIDQNVTQLGTTNFTAFQHNLQYHFLNPINLHNSSQLYSDLLDRPQMSSYYEQIFNGNICNLTMYTASEQTLCKSYLKGKLQGGINSVFSYYPTLDQTYSLEIQKVQYDFINVQILKLLQIWHQEFISSVQSSSNMLTLCLSIYSIISIIGFIFLWLLYLNKLNVRLNQTIQMLNMIPMKMLPKGRKDIRDFFNWIIKEANKNKNQE